MGTNDGVRAMSLHGTEPLVVALTPLLDGLLVRFWQGAQHPGWVAAPHRHGGDDGAVGQDRVWEDLDEVFDDAKLALCGA